MAHTARRIGIALVAAGAATGVAVGTSPGASADPVVTLQQTAKVSTHVAKPDKTVVFNGTQTVKIDLGATSNNLSADLDLKAATMKVDLPVIPGVFSIPGIATATLQIEPVGPATGNVNLATKDVEATQRFNVHITKLTPPIFSFLNLVPSKTCKTSTPASMHLTGKLTSLSDPLDLSSSYTIPSFSGCGLLTPLITQLTSGSGNTVNASFTPQL
ncbi:hypothetical protein [Flexivirga sp. B27]